MAEKAKRGEIVGASVVKAAYEREVGEPVALSTVYVLLHRHGWSKKQPRPRHPQGDEKEKNFFKKIR